MIDIQIITNTDTTTIKSITSVDTPSIKISAQRKVQRIAMILVCTNAVED